MSERLTVRKAAVVLLPSGLSGVLVQVAGRHEVVLPGHHAAQAGEEALGLVRVGAVSRVGLGVIDAAGVGKLGLKLVPMGRLVGIDLGAVSDVLLGQGDALSLALGNEREGAALALAHNDDDAALGVQVDLEATILPVFLAVLRAHGAAEVGTVDLDLALKAVPGRLSRKGLAQLVSEDEGGLVGHVQIAAELQGGQALHGVHEDGDGGAQVREGELPAGEDRARRDAELLAAAGALEATAGADVVVVQATAGGAHGLAIRQRPAKALEGLVGRVLAALVDRLEREGSSG